MVLSLLTSLCLFAMIWSRRDIHSLIFLHGPINWLLNKLLFDTAQCSLSARLHVLQHQIYKLGCIFWKTTYKQHACQCYQICVENIQNTYFIIPPIFHGETQYLTRWKKSFIFVTTFFRDVCKHMSIYIYMDMYTHTYIYIYVYMY